MKKFFGVVLAVVFCMCMMVPAAFAASETDAIAGGIADLIGGVVSSDSVLGELGLEDFDVEGLINSFVGEEDEDVDVQVKVEEAIQGVEATVADEMSSLGLDLSFLTTLLGDEVDAAAVTSMFSDFDTSNLPDLLAVISSAIGTAGIDMANFDASALGNFDIATLLGGSDDVKVSDTATGVASPDSSMATTDLITGVIDGLTGGLSLLGLDADALLSSMSDNEIINFFANMYLGFIGDVEETTTAAPTTTPDTGDTSSVVVALATLCVATAAAGVCLKKKED